MIANIVHPQPPRLGRSAALMLMSLAVHGLLLWGLVRYSLQPAISLEFMRAPEPRAIQVMVISPPKPLPLLSPVQPVAQAPAPPAVPVATPHAAQPKPIAQAAPPVEAPAQTAVPAQATAPAPAPTPAVNVPVAMTASTEKPAEPPLVQGHPDYAYNPPPNYPQALHEQGLGGVVWLRVWVDSDGRPGEIKLSKGSGYRLLDDAALRAVRTWRFVPARTGDQRQSSWVEFPIRFNPDI